MKRSVILTLAGTFMINMIIAQNNRNPNQINRYRAPSLSFGLQVSEPVGEFGQYYDGTPVGLNVAFLSNIGRSPFEMGGGFTWQSMGSQDKDIYIYSGEDIFGDEIFEPGDMSVRNNAYLYHGLFRLKPFAGRIQPYGELVGGVSTYNVKSVVSLDDDFAEQIDKNIEHRDIALSYGWAAGLKIRLTQFMMLEGRFANLQGTEVNIVDPEGISISEDGLIDFEETRTETDTWNFQVGLSFEF